MKKVILAVLVLASLTSCKKWFGGNQTVADQIEGIWVGENFQTNISAQPFLDTTDVQNSSAFTANFMANGGVTIDSSGVRVDSMGWYVRNDTILVLSGISLGVAAPIPGGTPTASGDLGFDIQKLTSEELDIRYDTTFTLSVPGVPIPISIDFASIQRWQK